MSPKMKGISSFDSISSKQFTTWTLFRDHKYTINITHALPHNMGCAAVIPSESCGSPIYVFHRSSWCRAEALIIAAGERLQSNEESSVRFPPPSPPRLWAEDQTMRKPASDAEHLPLAPWCKPRANPPFTCIREPGWLGAVSTLTLWVMCGARWRVSRSYAVSHWCSTEMLFVDLGSIFCLLVRAGSLNKTTGTLIISFQENKQKWEYRNQVLPVWGIRMKRL